MKKSLVRIIICFAFLAAAVAPRAAATLELSHFGSAIALPHTAEEILLRRQGSGKLQEGECGEAPAQFAEKVALIERARAFARELGIWSDTMYKCFDPNPETGLWVYLLYWYPYTLLAESRQRMGWLSANYNPVSGLYVNVWTKGVRDVMPRSLPDMTGKDIATMQFRLVEEGNAWYGRWAITNDKKNSSEDFFSLPDNQIVENFLHEGCHDFIAKHRLDGIRSRPELEEPLCTMYGFRAGMAFLSLEDNAAEREALLSRYRWSLQRAAWLNSLWSKLEAAFGGVSSEGERAARMDEIFRALTPSDILSFLGGAALNTAIVSSVYVYTKFLPAAEELWQVLTGEPTIDLTPPPPEDTAGTG